LIGAKQFEFFGGVPGTKPTGTDRRTSAVDVIPSPANQSPFASLRDEQ